MAVVMGHSETLSESARFFGENNLIVFGLIW